MPISMATWAGMPSSPISRRYALSSATSTFGWLIDEPSIRSRALRGQDFRHISKKPGSISAPVG